MVSAEEILIRIKGQDQTGGAFSSVESKAKGMTNALQSATGMLIGMVGYDLVNSLVEAGRGAINASQQLDYYAGRLKMSESQTKNFRSELDSLQNDFRKVDMSAVGATAEEMAVKYKLPIDVLGDLTKATAVTSSAFVKDGNTQENAILAVSDALDGQWKRMQEIGVTQDMLKSNGWNGDLNDKKGLVDALNKSLEDLGHTQTAKDITSLDDAWSALTVSGGQLLASVLIPLTPAFVALTDAIIGTIDFFKDNGWAQGAILIGGLALGVGLLAGAIVGLEAPIMTVVAGAMPAFITSLYSAATALWTAEAPILPIIAILAALALAVYEVGIYFGWWKDVGSMLDAIGAGVRRLWSAFINNPQVQAAIKAVQNALNELWQFIQPVFAWIGDAWANIFGDSGSSPDVVRAIIDAFGQLGNIAGTVFGYLQQGFQAVWYVISPIVDMLGGLIGIFSALASGSISWQDAIMQAFTTIWTGLSTYQTRLGQIALQVGSRIFNGVMSFARRIPGMLWSLLVQAGQRILSFGNTAAARARNAGMRILNGIINYIRQLPGRVATFMMQVPGRIAQAAGAAVGAAASLASQVVSAVTNGVVGVADSVYNEFMNIGSKINDAVSGAVSAASNFGSDIKNAVLSALQIASPGIIQRKIAIEFADIPGRIGESNDYVYNAARDYAGNIMRGFNAPRMPLTSINAMRTQNGYNPSTSTNGNTTIIYVQPGAATIDARNMTENEAVKVVTAAFESLFPTGG